MIGRSNFAIGVLLCVCGTTQLGATTLSFDEAVTFYGSPGVSNFGKIGTQGFDIEASGGYGHYLADGAHFCMPQCPDNGSTYLLSWGATITISAQDNAAFSLLQFDAAEGAQGLTMHWAEALAVSGDRDGTTVARGRFDLDWSGAGGEPSNQFQTIAVTGFANLTSLSFAAIGGLSGDFSLDNLVLGPALADLDSGLTGSELGVIATPLPAAGWLFATALIGFAGLGRRRARTAA